MKLNKYMAGVAILFVGLLICGSLDFDGIAQEMAVVDDGAPTCVNGQCGPQVVGERSSVSGPVMTYASSYGSSSSCGVSQAVQRRVGFFQRVRQRGGLFGGWRPVRNMFRGRVANYGCGG
jgi:hypothetical protein